MLQWIAFLAVVCTACVALNRRFERVLAPTLCGLMVLLYALAIPRALLLVDWIAPAVLALAALFAAGALASLRISPRELASRFAKNVLTPGALCFAGLCALFIYASGPMVVWWGDDAGYWALETKSLWYYGGLVGADQHLALFYGTYLPGMQLVQWWAMHAFGQWSEPVLYASLFIAYAAFLLPLFDRVSWRRSWILPFVFVGVVAFPLWGNALSYIILSVDTALALCFGYALARIWQLKPGDRAGLLGIGLSLCAMVLIKQIGILFALLAIVLMLVLGRWHGHRRAGLCACWLSPIAILGSWTLFCSLAGISGFHTSSLWSAAGGLLSGSYALPEKAGQVAPSILNAIFAPLTNTGRFSSRLVNDIMALLPLPLGVRLLVIIFLPLCLIRCYPAREMIRISLFSLAATAAYTLVIYGSFFTVFLAEFDMYVQEDLSNMTLLLERYYAPITLGLGMLAAALVIGAFPRLLARRWKPLPAVCLTLYVATLALTVNWSALADDFVPERYIQYDEALGVEGETYMDHYWGEALAGYEGARVLVGLEPNNSFIGLLNYTFAPAQFFCPEWDDLESTEALCARLVEDGITHLIYFDEAGSLYEIALPLAADGELYSWTLYEVLPDEAGGVSLAEYYN